MRIPEPRACIKKHFLEEIDRKAREGGALGQKCWEDLEEKLGVPTAMLQRISTPDQRMELENWLQLQEGRVAPQGRRWHWMRFASRDSGTRFGKDGQKLKTFQSHFKTEESRVKQWARRQEAMGMALSLEDLHDEFYVLLESVAFDLGRRQDELGFLIRVRLQRTQKRFADLQKPHNKKYSRDWPSYAI